MRKKTLFLTFAMMLMLISHNCIFSASAEESKACESRTVLSVHGSCMIRGEAAPDPDLVYYSGFASDDGYVSLSPSNFEAVNGNTVDLSFSVYQDTGRDICLKLFWSNPKHTVVSEYSIPSGAKTCISVEAAFNYGRSLCITSDDIFPEEIIAFGDITGRILSYDDKALAYEKYPLDIPSLKELCGSFFTFGGAISASETKDAKRMAFYASQFSILTPGNELKPDAVFDRTKSRKLVEESGDERLLAVRINSAVPILNFCRDNGISVHGHTLLWHNQTPEDFFHLGYDPSKPLADREIMLARMENYIKSVLELTEESYPGLIVSWDVVNEAIDDGTGSLRTKVNWYKTVGPDYVEKAFEYARKYARPDILLCYNDYNTVTGRKLNGILSLLETLTAQGNIDCYGFQSHYDCFSPGAAMVEKAFIKMIDMGLKIRISELDVKMNGKTDTNIKMQAKKYSEMFSLYKKYGADIAAVQIWGCTDDTSWLLGKYPLPFAAYGQPKPAYFAIQDALNADN